MNVSSADPYFRGQFSDSEFKVPENQGHAPVLAQTYRLDSLLISYLTSVGEPKRLNAHGQYVHFPTDIENTYPTR